MKLADVAPGDRLTLGNITLEVFRARHPVPAVMYRLTGADGKVLCFTGDTNTVEGLREFARDADLLLADGLFPTEAWAEGKPHLSALQTAELARDAGAKRLVITHLSPLFDENQLLFEAREAFPGAELARCGGVWEL